MDNWTVEPLDHVNGVKFGMARKEVREKLGGKYSEFKKSKFSKTTADDFGFCHVFYNKRNKCEAIEIFADVAVEVKGNVIFPADLSMLKNVAQDFEKEDEGYISRSQSIGVYAPGGDMESILFGEKGYYGD